MDQEQADEVEGPPCALAKGDEFVTHGWRWKVDEVDGDNVLILPVKKIGGRHRKPRKKVAGRNKARR